MQQVNCRYIHIVVLRILHIKLVVLRIHIVVLAYYPS